VNVSSANKLLVEPTKALHYSIHMHEV